MSSTVNYSKITEIGIPFYRYSYMISPQNTQDIFVWLYLSLFIYQNKVDNKDPHSYSDDTKEKTCRILTNKFGTIIDKTKLAKILSFVENKKKGFIIYNTTTKMNELDGNIEDFLETYESLFSKNLQDIKVFQNAITGEIVPYFKDEPLRNNVEIKFSGNIKCINENENVKKPNSKMIEKSLDLSKILQDPSTYEESNEIYEETDALDPFAEFEEENEQVYFDDDFVFYDDNGDKILTLADSEKEDKYSGLTSNFTATYIDDTKVKYNLKIEIGLKDNELVFVSPFNDETNYWIKKSLLKAANIDSNLKKVIDDCKEYIVKDVETDENQETILDKHDIADKLTICGPIYRRVKPLNDKTINKYVIGIDERFLNNDKFFYSEIGNFLEYLVKLLRDDSNNNYRTSYGDYDYYNQIEAKGEYVFDYKRLMSKTIYKQWADNSDMFKSLVAGIVISKNINSCRSLYFDFINDLFEIYDWRSKYSSHDSVKYVKPTSEHVDKLFKVVNVLCELIEMEGK